jgi:hypothetical protein
MQNLHHCWTWLFSEQAELGSALAREPLPHPSWQQVAKRWSSIALWFIGLGFVSCGSALAQQPVRTLPKTGGCPLGYYASGSYCVPSKSSNTHGAIEKVGGGCPLGFYSSGNYCLSSPSNDREAIQKTGNSCPLGWFSSGNYCVKSR